MEETLPFLEISGPNDQQFRVELAKNRMTIGRYKQFNDIVLQPDPERLITRNEHCVLEYDGNNWWLIDNRYKSGDGHRKNPTCVRHESKEEKVQERMLLSDGDCIRILAKHSEQGTRLYWELMFRDPAGTLVDPEDMEQDEQTTYLDYDHIQARLFHVKGTVRQEIHDLRRLEHELIRYMAKRNRAENNNVMCTFNELLVAVWTEKPETPRTNSDLHNLVGEARKKLGSDGPVLLQTVRGFGFRLITYPSMI